MHAPVHCPVPSPLRAFRWIGGPLVLGLFLALTGCDASSIADPEGPAQLAPTPGEESLPSDRQAYYMLHADDITEPGWQKKLKNYRVFVCDPSFDHGKLQRVRSVVPDAILLAATSAQDILIDTFRNSPYFRALTARFDSSLCIRDLDTGNVVRVYSRDPGNPDVLGVPAFVMRQESADVLANFHRDVTMHFDWDGLYIDMLTDRWTKWRKQRLTGLARRFDIDDDGLADSLEDLDQTYRRWRPYYTARLREIVGDDKILIGNSGGRMADPALNGITLEKVGERFSIHQARFFFTIQKLYSRHAPLSIAWVFDERHEQPSMSLAYELGWVHFGTIDP